MKNIFFILVAFAAVAFGGKYYVETQYKKEFNKVIELAKPYTNISYRNLKVGFDGSLSIQDLSFRNLAETGSFHVGKAVLTTSDKLFVLRGKGVIKNNQIPDSLEVEFNEIISDSILIEPKKENACTSLHTAFNYSEIGINRLYSDMTMSFDFTNKNDAKATVHYQDQTVESDLKFNFSENDIQNSAASNILPIDNIEMNASIDPTLALEFNKFCAKKLGLTVNQYLNQVVASPKFSFDSVGYNFGDQVSAALAKLMQGGTNINIVSKPSQTLKNLKSFSTNSRKDIAQGLNLSIKLDDQPIVVKTETNNDFISKKVENAKSEISLERQIERLKPKKRSYVDDSASNLSNLVDQRVKIWRDDDRPRLDGRVESYANDVAFIEIRKLGGKVVYKVPVDEIAKIQVLK